MYEVKLMCYCLQSNLVKAEEINKHLEDLKCQCFCCLQCLAVKLSEPTRLKFTMTFVFHLMTIAYCTGNTYLV